MNKEVKKAEIFLFTNIDSVVVW